jgi:hypothetical protein
MRGGGDQVNPPYGAFFRERIDRGKGGEGKFRFFAG